MGNRTHILSERLKAGTEFKRLKKGHRPAPMPLKQTHILSYKPHFKPEVAQEQFNLPKGVYPYHMLVCGYPADHIADPEHREARTIPLSDFLLK